MGSQIKLEQGKKPTFDIKVGGTADLKNVTVCRFNGETWTEPMSENIKRGNDRFMGTWEDTEIDASGIYYIRVLQRDGERAWSSPIWVQAEAK